MRLKSIVLIIFSLIFICVSCNDQNLESISNKSFEVDSQYGKIKFDFKEDDQVTLKYLDEKSKSVYGSYRLDKDDVIIKVDGYEYLALYDGKDFTLLSEGDTSKSKTDNKEEILTYDYDGLERTYVLKLPKNHKDRPLVLVLHGFGGNISTIDSYMAFGALGEKFDFAVCYPQALSGKEKDGAYWNANWGLEGDPDDIGFLSSLVEDLVEEYDLDKDKIFVCGYSNGGFMTYSLALNAPEVFSKAAVISGLMSHEDWQNKGKGKPISILHIHGIDDQVIEIEDSVNYGMSVREIVDYWRQTNAASELVEEKIGQDTTSYRYLGSDHEVWYYKVANWGHEIPNSHTSDFNASELIWSFFDKD